MKNYVSRMSFETEWDIMKMAVAKGDIDLICNMLKDGYSISFDLLELIYRFLGQPAVLAALNSTVENLSEDENILLFLKETLDPSTYQTVLSNNEKMLERMEELREEACESKLEQVLTDLCNEEGERSESFYTKIAQSPDSDLMEIAFKRYGYKTVCDDLFKHKLLSFVQSENQLLLPEPEYWPYLMYIDIDYLLEINQPYAAAMCLKYYYTGDDIVDQVFKVANAGGLKYFVYFNSVYLHDLLEDEKMRNKIKELGSIGYKTIYRFAKKHFTLDDWYKWYELNPNEAIQRAHICSVPRSWLIKNGYIKKAIFGK